jgi:hypothetical protein
VIAAVAVFATPTPSLAAGDDFIERCDSLYASCQTGVRVSAGAGDCRAEGAYNKTLVCVDYSGDYVYVYDGKEDDASAMALVSSSRSSVTARYCRNPHGVKSWARCNFDWSEGELKIVSGGYRRSYNSWRLGEMWQFYNK